MPPHLSSDGFLLQPPSYCLCPSLVPDAFAHSHPSLWVPSCPPLSPLPPPSAESPPLCPPPFTKARLPRKFSEPDPNAPQHLASFYLDANKCRVTVLAQISC